MLLSQAASTSITPLAGGYQPQRVLAIYPFTLASHCYNGAQHRHETYDGQYRAMFVVNCNVDAGESLTFKEAKEESKKHRSRDARVQAQTAAQAELFHPVKCNDCRTVVAVYDADEVYHFFNVISGAID
jgi:hypothetical protein